MRPSVTVLRQWKGPGVAPYFHSQLKVCMVKCLNLGKTLLNPGELRAWESK